jgi:hypothetical protein
MGRSTGHAVGLPYSRVLPIRAIIERQTAQHSPNTNCGSN